MFRLPLCHCTEPILDGEGTSGGVVEPGGQAQAASFRGHGGSGGNLVVKCHGQFSYSHETRWYYRGTTGSMAIAWPLSMGDRFVHDNPGPLGVTTSRPPGAVPSQANSASTRRDRISRPPRRRHLRHAEPVGRRLGVHAGLTRVPGDRHTSSGTPPASGKRTRKAPSPSRSHTAALSWPQSTCLSTSTPSTASPRTSPASGPWFVGWGRPEPPDCRSRTTTRSSAASFPSRWRPSGWRPPPTPRTTTVVAEVGVPVNVLILPGGPSIPELAAAGVRRVPTGGALARSADAELRRPAANTSRPRPPVTTP